MMMYATNQKLINLETTVSKEFEGEEEEEEEEEIFI